MNRLRLGGICLAALAAIAGARAAETAAASKDLRVVNAAMQDDVDGVKRLIVQKADLNAAQGDGMTALHWAAFKDDATLAKLLIAAGANVQAVTRIGALTPLHVAAKNGNAEMIGALVKAGAPVNTASTDGMTPLMAVAISGDTASLKVLLDAKADVNVREKAHGQTALMFAAAEGRAGIIRELAKAGADLKLTTDIKKLEAARFDDNGNPLPQRGRGGEAPAGGSTVTGGNTVMGGMTALLFAARDGHLDAVKALLDAGADVNQQSASEQSTPLVIAIANGHFAMGKYLVEHGANPNIANVDNLTPLYATVNMRFAPVSWAPNPVIDQELDGLELIKTLLAHKADPNVRIKRKLWFSPTSHDQQWINPTGATALWRAAQSSDLAAMKLLVAGGADPKIATNGGDTVLMAAAGLGWSANFTQNAPEGFLETTKYCLDLGLDVNAVDNLGYTALFGAAYRGDNDIVKLLVSKGAKTDVKSKRGWSLTDMANGPVVNAHLPMVHEDTVALLQQLGAPAPQSLNGESNLGSGRGRRPVPPTEEKKEEIRK